MTKQINLDIDAIKDDFFKGLTLKECIFGALALISGAGTALLLTGPLGASINAAVTLSIPVAGAIGICGFYERNGMGLPEIMRRGARIRKGRPLTYETGVNRLLDFCEEPEPAGDKKGFLIRLLEKQEQKRR